MLRRRDCGLTPGLTFAITGLATETAPVGGKSRRSLLVAMLATLPFSLEHVRGMTEAQAARRFGVCLPAYRKIESEERMLDSDTHNAICKLLGWHQVIGGP